MNCSTGCDGTLGTPFHYRLMHLGRVSPAIDISLYLSLMDLWKVGKRMR